MKKLHVSEDPRLSNLAKTIHGLITSNPNGIALSHHLDNTVDEINAAIKELRNCKYMGNEKNGQFWITDRV